MIRCDDCQDQLDELLLGHLPEDQASVVRRHLENCRGCQDLLREARELWATVADEFADTELPDSVSRRVFARIGQKDREPGAAHASRAFDGVTDVTAASPTLTSLGTWQGTWQSYGVAAAVLFLLTAGSLFYLSPAIWQSREHALVDARLHSLAKDLNRMEELEQEYGHPSLVHVSLRSQSTAHRMAAQSSGYFVWDRTLNQWHLFAANLPPAGTAQVHRLWMELADGQVKLAGELEVNQAGDAAIVIDGAVGTPIRRWLLTLDARANTSRPSSTVLLDAEVADVKEPTSRS